MTSASAPMLSSAATVSCGESPIWASSTSRAWRSFSGSMRSMRSKEDLYWVSWMTLPRL
ncbi:Uncharacterised protein [Mycobacteroides abscessus subsp. abscessus]|nr:Uncharacterised protein [Mycobacteroides abscessus subsp. abscessus]